MDIKKQAEEISKMGLKLSMPVWKWVAIGAGVILILGILTFCAVS